MTKLIPILSGRCLVVELPEGALLPEIDDGNLYYYVHKHDVAMTIPLPTGNWRIIGMLSEVTDAELADVTGFYYNKYNERYVEMPTSAMRATPIGDIEDAIRAGGWYFENPYGEEEPTIDDPDQHSQYFGAQMDLVVEWNHKQSRVLDRSRCLLLGRE